MNRFRCSFWVGVVHLPKARPLLLRRGVVGVHLSEGLFHLAEDPDRVGNQIRRTVAFESRNQILLTLDTLTLVENIRPANFDRRLRLCGRMGAGRSVAVMKLSFGPSAFCDTLPKKTLSCGRLFHSPVSGCRDRLPARFRGISRVSIYERQSLTAVGLFC
jgi:hypothetical protein